MRKNNLDNNGKTPLPPELFEGRSAAMRELIKTVQAVAPSSLPVLIQGESGTGKELCVQRIHESSGRPSASLTKVSCPASPQALLEAELFGYEKGAFTGANVAHKGRVEQSHNGSLFLDEIGSLDLSMQVKLLSFLQDGSFSRVGGHETHRVHTRLISVANRNLSEQVSEGGFRLDLLHRINTVNLTMPPLRERTEDIPDLLDYFLEETSRKFRVAAPPLPRDALQHLVRYSWPGNIRELENLVQSFVLIGKTDLLFPEEPAPRFSLTEELDLSHPTSLKTITREATHELERRIILKVLKANGWNRKAAARWLKISYRSLLYKLQEIDTADAPQIKPALKPAAGDPEQKEGSRLMQLSR
jgi:two-component system response regulator AtoC